ncbi:SRPBCC family protein [Streptacidiphilus griseoplanus]|uniref:SRPBCC family protein n=1 Tax=Peterkaempfera griseoplana TaxID=66896 RepID=UPI0006E3FEB8|nr:SRPBCC family protein [Peterkaempfera griseoplana]
MHTASLPYIDEHTAVIDAPCEEVWRSLGEALDQAFSGPGATGYARLVGASPGRAAGPRPLAEGSALAGFRVVAADPGRELVLEGRHRFSRYTLTFRLERVGPARTRLSAESRAAFPGVAGAAYRGLVIGTGGHVVGVRRLLGAVRRGCGPATGAGTG